MLNTRLKPEQDENTLLSFPYIDDFVADFEKMGWYVNIVDNSILLLKNYPISGLEIFEYLKNDRTAEKLLEIDPRELLLSQEMYTTRTMIQALPTTNYKPGYFRLHSSIEMRRNIINLYRCPELAYHFEAFSFIRKKMLPRIDSILLGWECTNIPEYLNLHQQLRI